jgi:hypothetical protein
MAIYEFPSHLYDDRNGHYMRITATSRQSTFRPGSSLPVVTDTFVLPMPQGKKSYTYEHRHTYADVKLSRVAMGMAGVSGYADAIETGMSLLGAPMNPAIEVIYESTNLRDFKFSFLFAPETDAESRMVENICRRMRFHAAPEIIGGGTTGRTQGWFAAPPSKFNIDYNTLVNGTWERNNTANPKLPRIYEGYIDAIGVNYAPADGLFSTFSNGYPVAVELEISFKETRIIDKRLIEEQGY